MTPDIAFSSRRQIFEARALTEIANNLNSAHRKGVHISLPKLLYSDLVAHFIIIEDLSSAYHLQLLNPMSSVKWARLVSQFGGDTFSTQATVNVARALGAWLFDLHSLGRNTQLKLRERFDHAGPRKVQVLTTLGEFMRSIELCGTKPESEREQRVRAILI